jgi:hypothetical protein
VGSSAPRTGGDEQGWAIALDGKDLRGSWADNGRLVLFSAMTHRTERAGAVLLPHGVAQSLHDDGEQVAYTVPVLGDLGERLVTEDRLDVVAVNGQLQLKVLSKPAARTVLDAPRGRVRLVPEAAQPACR